MTPDDDPRVDMLAETLDATAHYLDGGSRDQVREGARMLLARLDAAATARAKVHGRCPNCGHLTLLVGDGGHLTCSADDCDDPDMVDDLLSFAHRYGDRVREVRLGLRFPQQQGIDAVDFERVAAVQRVLRRVVNVDQTEGLVWTVDPALPVADPGSVTPHALPDFARHLAGLVVAPAPHPRFIPMRTGDTHGRLTIVEDRHPGEPTVLARCQCGTVRRFDAYSVRSGHTASCGCLQKDMTRAASVGRPPVNAGRSRPALHPLEGDDDL